MEESWRSQSGPIQIGRLRLGKWREERPKRKMTAIVRETGMATETARERRALLALVYLDSGRDLNGGLEEGIVDLRERESGSRDYEKRNWKKLGRKIGMNF